MDGPIPLLVQVAMGIGLAASAGLRAFLPLFVAGLAGRLGWVPLSPPFDWLASWPALVVFGVAVVTEILSDKIPLIDHFLDLLQGLIKPVAGTVLAAAMMKDLSPLQATVLGIIAGGTTTLVVHVTKAKLRLISTALTAGVGNPFLSLAEDAIAVIGTIAAMLVPLLLIALLAMVAFGIAFALLGLARRSRVLHRSNERSLGPHARSAASSG